MAAFKTPKMADLRYKVDIQQLGTPTPDGMGGYTANWVTILTAFVRMEAWKGREMLSSNQAGSEGWYEVAMRYRANITTAMRLYEADGDHVGRWYNIRFVADPDQHREWLQMTVEAIKQP